MSRRPVNRLRMLSLVFSRQGTEYEKNVSIWNLESETKCRLRCFSHLGKTEPKEA
jgi:hypothetical protein